MLESPLKKQKHSYPIDFSSKKKESPKPLVKKYDFAHADERNPQFNFEQKKSQAFMSQSSVSQLFIETYKKPSQTHNKQFFSFRQFEHIGSNSSEIKQENLFQKDNIGFGQNEQPLKEVKKKNHRIIVDENKLKNPRIELNEHKTIVLSQKTLETISPQKVQKQLKSNEIGSIRHQNFKIFEKFEEEKQPPLIAQQPFNLIQKNTKRNSLLEKLNLGRVNQKQQNNYHNYINSEVYSGDRVFRPETYTNRAFASSEEKLENPQKVTKVNSSFQAKKKQKILYINNQNLANLSFNLPNLSLINSTSKFKRQDNEKSFINKVKNSAEMILSVNKFIDTSKEKSSPRAEFDPDQITKLKAQINLIAKSKFKKKQGEYIPLNERQFTFQGSENEKNNQAFKSQSKKPVAKKITKKLQITYHVPLTLLKRLCKMYLSSPEMYSLAFKVPKIFMEENLFYKNQEKQQVHQNALFLFDSLKINPKDMVIKRYSNCLMLISSNVVVMWYYNGKRYLGGWQYEYLDEGSRHGLGLQWQPEAYIYYGQFRNNKKHGLGALKEGPQKVSVGFWANGKFIGSSWKQITSRISEQENSNHEDYSQRTPPYDNEENEYPE